MKNKKGFTLVELLMALLIAGSLIGIVMSIYTGIMGADVRMSDKRLLTTEASDLMDIIHTSALDYTIDYEEYFNRRGLGYGVGNTGFSSYGNSGEWYYCGSGFSNDNDFNNYEYNIFYWQSSGGCISGGNQKYGEYKFQHWRIVTGNLNSIDNSGSNLGFGPLAIEPNTGVDYLYLINPEGTERLYFRRFLKDPGLSENDTLYTLQMLRLKGFDAGNGKNFTGWGAYDGFIDTWACDYSQGFRCNGMSIITGYNLPSNADDGWVDITSDRITVSDFNVDIFPQKDPYLASKETGFIIDPFARISITLNVHGRSSLEKMSLSTVLSFKNTYFKFAIEDYPGEYLPD